MNKVIRLPLSNTANGRLYHAGRIDRAIQHLEKTHVRWRLHQALRELRAEARP